MRFKGYKILIGLAIITFIVVRLCCCKGIMTPAPSGIHGHFSAGTYEPNYETTISVDSFLTILKHDKIIIESGRLNDYDPPWDSLRYILGNITCDKEKIEAYIEFKDKRASNTTLQVIWFNAVPTMDNEEYKKRAENYYQCFEALLKKNNLIK